MVIDCYPSKNCDTERFRILHGRGKEFERHKVVLEEKNAIFQRNLERVKPIIQPANTCVDDYKLKYVNMFILLS